jgi:uncharacterized YccA/Bax inhibitor family protein
MRSGNPVLRDSTFDQAPVFGDIRAMTIQGTVNKTFLLLFLTMGTAVYTWLHPALVSPFLLPLVFGGLVVALVTVFKQRWAMVTGPLYAVIEGALLGVISLAFERSYPGIVMQSVGLTFGTLFCLLLAYTTRLIQATENFKLGVVAATGAVFIVYLVDIVLSLFHRNVAFIHSNGTFGLIFSAVVVTIAALNLVLDFDFIKQGARGGAPKYMEWYGAFGLIVTLIWLYLEILRMLAKSRSR